MREIKFRALFESKDGKKVWQYIILDKNFKSLRNIELAGVYCNQITDWCQFTGEFDKNRKEIYEGDVVNIEYETVNEVGESCMDFKEEVTVEWNYELLWQLEYDLKGVEIIGNIYENPELLEDK